MRILFYGDFGCATGFAKVSQNLVDRWIDKMGDKDELVILALNNHETEAYEYRDKAIVIPLLGTRDEKDKDHHCRNSFLRFLFSGEFEHIFLLNDLEVLSPLKKHITDIRKKHKEQKKKFKIHVYYPVDSVPLKKHMQFLDIANHVYPYNEWGRKHTENYCDSRKIEVVSHGVEHDVFYPMDAVETIFPQDAYVFGSINRNSQRKDVATLLQAFSIVKKKLENSNAPIILYLHMNPKDPFGLDIYEACEALDLEIGKDVWLPENFNENEGFSPERLNELYNMFDFFVTTTTAEGWGLTITEAMACGTPVIAPIHTSITEITDQGSLVYPLLDLRPFMFVNDVQKVRYLSSPNETSKRMLDALAEIDTEFQYDLIDKAIRWVAQYNWDDSAEIIYKNFKK